MSAPTIPAGPLRIIRARDPQYACLTPGCTAGNCRTCSAYADALVRINSLTADAETIHALLTAAGAPVVTTWQGAGQNHGDAMDAPLPLVERVRWVCGHVRAEVAA